MAMSTCDINSIRTGESPDGVDASCGRLHGDGNIDRVGGDTPRRPDELQLRLRDAGTTIEALERRNGQLEAERETLREEIRRQEEKIVAYESKLSRLPEMIEAILERNDRLSMATMPTAGTKSSTASLQSSSSSSSSSLPSSSPPGSPLAAQTGEKIGTPSLASSSSSYFFIPITRSRSKGGGGGGGNEIEGGRDHGPPAADELREYTAHSPTYDEDGGYDGEDGSPFHRLPVRQADLLKCVLDRREQEQHLTHQGKRPSSYSLWWRMVGSGSNFSERASSYSVPLPTARTQAGEEEDDDSLAEGGSTNPVEDVDSDGNPKLEADFLDLVM